MRTIDQHTNVQQTPEHGRIFWTCIDCGRQWAEHDTNEGPELEVITEGDGYCDTYGAQRIEQLQTQMEEAHATLEDRRRRYSELQTQAQELADQIEKQRELIREARQAAQRADGLYTAFIIGPETPIETE